MGIKMIETAEGNPNISGSSLGRAFGWGDLWIPKLKPLVNLPT